MTHTQVTIHGYVVGTIWMPAAECFKHFTYDLTREAKRKAGATFRDHVTDIINDGDFQSCAIAQGEVEVRRFRHRKHGQGVYEVTRVFPLSMFPSVADCLHADHDDWFPPCDWED